MGVSPQGLFASDPSDYKAQGPMLCTMRANRMTPLLPRKHLDTDKPIHWSLM